MMTDINSEILLLRSVNRDMKRRIASLEAMLREKQDSQEALWESEERLKLAMIGADLGSWDWDVPSGALTFSERWPQMLGYALDEIEPHVSAWKTLVHPDDLPRMMISLNAHLEGRTDGYEMEHRMRRKSGEWIWVLAKGRVIDRDAQGKPLRVCGTHLDITERKRAEEKLNHFHNLMRYIIEHTRSSVAVHDRDLKYIYVSQRYLDEYKVKEQDVIGKHHYEVFPDLPQKWRDVHQKALAGEVSSAEDDPYVREDGSVDWTRWECRPWYEADGSIGGIIVYTEVITERKRAEKEREKLQAQLVQAQKMESVGRLAGGVAHDFNNMLNVILGHAELALTEVNPEQPIHAHLTEIQKAAWRSVDLTRQLLAFARKQTVSPKVLDLNDTVEGMLKMLKPLIGEDIDLAWIPGKELWPVKMDPSQIDHILANLCVNARDAIAGVGKVTIETSNATLDACYCRNHAGFTPGEYVSLIVSDDGCGMTQETLAHLFEPFFTTKDVGKGTGLGLATVYGIVKQNDGLINVYSEPGRGTTFKIYLARHVGETEQLQTRGPAETLSRGHETVLLVEDEPAVLKMGKMMLEILGYRVLSAGTPGEAIGLADKHAGEIHLLMTDVIMPEMNGRDLAKRLSARYPNLKRLFTSGYTANVIARHGVLDEGVQFIQKPFSMKNLAIRVREVLGQE